MMNFAVILALFALNATPTHGIKCYLCTPEHTNNALQLKSDPSQEAWLRSPPCSRSTGDKYECSKEEVCVEMNLSKGRNRGLYRACTPKEPTGCKENELGNSCICDTDLCNCADPCTSPTTTTTTRKSRPRTRPPGNSVDDDNESDTATFQSPSMWILLVGVLYVIATTNF